LSIILDRSGPGLWRSKDRLGILSACLSVV
jgi:hypothetical protein